MRLYFGVRSPLFDMENNEKKSQRNESTRFTDSDNR